MHLLGFRFAPRIRDLADTKLYLPKKDASYAALKPMIGAPIAVKQVRAHWNDILRLATSIKQGTVTASLMLWIPGDGDSDSELMSITIPK